MDATPRSPAATEHASAEVLAIATEYGGPPRKAAFSMLEAARRYCDHLQWQAACDVLLVAAAQLQLHPLQWLHHSDTRPKAETSGGNIATDLGDLAVCGGEGVEDNARGARSHGGLALRMVGSSSRGWPRLRKTVLAMLLEVAEAMDDTTLYTSLALFTLRLFESALPEDAQRQLFRQLEQRATPTVAAHGRAGDRLAVAALAARRAAATRAASPSTAALESLRRAEHANGLHLLAV